MVSFQAGPMLQRPPGTFPHPHGSSVAGLRAGRRQTVEETMDGIIYLVGLVVIIMAVLSFFGLR